MKVNRPYKPWNNIKEAEEREPYFWGYRRKGLYTSKQKPCLHVNCGAMSEGFGGGQRGKIVLETDFVEMGSASYDKATKLADCLVCKGKGWLTPSEFTAEYKRVIQEYENSVIEYDSNKEKVRDILNKLTQGEIVLLRNYWNPNEVVTPGSNDGI